MRRALGNTNSRANLGNGQPFALGSIEKLIG